MPCNFSVAHYREILDTALRSGYRFIQYEELDALPAGQRACILRHDIEYVPEQAIAIARTEHALGIRATYFFQTAAKSYNLREAGAYRVVHDVKAMGHTVGLHFDVSWSHDTGQAREVGWDDIPASCARDKAVFELITGIAPCEIVSFHNTHCYGTDILNRQFPGMRHTYEQKYFSDIKYLSDSQGWYHGCPCVLFAAGTYPVIQLLTHEYIWPEATTWDFISDMAVLMKFRTDDLLDYLIKYHPVCRTHEARLRREVAASHQL